MDFEPGLALTFVAVAEEKSFTRAAERLGMPQPQVSIRIRKLERTLGCVLFDRTTRRVQLTARGVEFLPLAQDIAHAVRAARRFADSCGAQRERLALGSVEIAKVLPLRHQIVNAFVNKYPAIELDVYAEDDTRLCSKLLSGELDILLTFTPPRFALEGVEVHVLRRFFAMLRVPAECPLAQCETIPLSALAGAQLLLSPGTICPTLIDTLRRQLQALEISVHRSPEAVAETALNIASTRRMLTFAWVEEGANTPPCVAVDDMVARPVEGNPFWMAFSFLTSTGRRPTRSARRFIQLAEEMAVHAAAETSVA